jgi:hypothetical protein
MTLHALMVVADEPGTYHWVILNVDGQKLEAAGSSSGEFTAYADALKAGTLALAAADGHAHENEAADPVGDAG